MNTPNFSMNDMLQAFQVLAQTQGQNKLQLQREGQMAPQTRHLGMSGEDITGQKGPYDSGGIDWLHAHNGSSGGNVPVDPMAQQNTLRETAAAFAPKAATPFQMLPFTLENTRPSPPFDPNNPTAYDAGNADIFRRSMRARGQGYQTPSRF